MDPSLVGEKVKGIDDNILKAADNAGQLCGIRMMRLSQIPNFTVSKRFVNVLI